MTVQTQVRDLRPDEVPSAVGVLARGMRDNPVHVAAYGSGPERRLRCHARLLRGLFRAFPAQQPICAVRSDALVGVTGMARAGVLQTFRLRRDRRGVGARSAELVHAPRAGGDALTTSPKRFPRRSCGRVRSKDGTTIAFDLWGDALTSASPAGLAWLSLPDPKIPRSPSPAEFRLDAAAMGPGVMRLAGGRRLMHRSTRAST